ncbi:MAG: hypothetical protein ACLPSW_03730 [Roseiarcus sp.]|jgi:hypothetical protein
MSERRVLPIGKELADQYRGTGLVLAAINDEIVVNFVYLRTLLPECDDGLDDFERWIDDPRLGPAIDELKSLGAVVMAMASCCELTTL